MLLLKSAQFGRQGAGRLLVINSACCSVAVGGVLVHQQRNDHDHLLVSSVPAADENDYDDHDDIDSRDDEEDAGRNLHRREIFSGRAAAKSPRTTYL